jgi:hypothetical protein
MRRVRHAVLLLTLLLMLLMALLPTMLGGFGMNVRNVVAGRYDSRVLKCQGALLCVI